MRLRVLVIFIAAFSAGCQTSTAPKASQPSTAPQSIKPTSIKVHINPKTLSFKHPGTGHVFFLHLSERLEHDTGGITEVPKNINIGVRDATSSYYEPTDSNGCGYACAESLYSHYDHPDRVARNTEIQYQPDTRRLLITEDNSDGQPCRRYILYTPDHLGYKVTYLTPILLPPHYKVPTFITLEIPPDIHLLPGDRAEIDGKIVKVDDIAQSPHPFSVGP